MDKHFKWHYVDKTGGFGISDKNSKKQEEQIFLKDFVRFNDIILNFSHAYVFLTIYIYDI